MVKKGKSTMAKKTTTDNELAPLSRMPRGFRLTPTGLHVQDGTNIGFAKLLEVGEQLFRLRRASNWAIGDWFILVNEWGTSTSQQHPDKCMDLPMLQMHRFNNDQDFSTTTRNNIIRVCKAFQPEERRASLSFSVHSEIAAIKNNYPGRAKELLDWLEQEYSVLPLQGLRRIVNQIKASPDEPVEHAIKTAGQIRHERVTASAKQAEAEEVMSIPEEELVEGVKTKPVPLADKQAEGAVELIQTALKSLHQVIEARKVTARCRDSVVEALKELREELDGRISELDVLPLE
jgi:hypothetical protein